MNFEQPIEKQAEVNPDKYLVEEILEEILIESKDPLIKDFIEFEKHQAELPSEIGRRDIRGGLLIRFAPLVKKMRENFLDETNAEEKARTAIKSAMTMALKTAVKNLPPSELWKK